MCKRKTKAPNAPSKEFKMNQQMYRTMKQAMILATSIMSTVSLGFAQDQTSKASAEFFALDGIYDRGLSDEPSLPVLERTAIAARLSFSGERPATDASDGAEPAQTSPFGARAPRTAAPQLPARIAEHPFRVRPFDDDSSGAFTSIGVGMFVASGADLLSTEIGLGRPGIVETNPMQQGRTLRIATHVAAPAAMWWITEKVRRQGKPKLALLMRIGFSVAYSYAVMHNVRTIDSLP
jgi:hypothetical protein